jgi:hypothetical protein
MQENYTFYMKRHRQFELSTPHIFKLANCNHQYAVTVHQHTQKHNNRPDMETLLIKAMSSNCHQKHTKPITINQKDREK